MRRTSYILAVLCLLASMAARAQTNISGVINRYTAATFIDKCNASIAVRNPFGFAAGDKVLIIQMKGASIDLVDHSGFGDITAYNNAGNYELATVDEVNGFTLVLHNKLAREYDVSGLVQVIRVPQYTDVTVTGTLTAKPWDGETGGVLAFIASGTVTLNVDIDVSGKGFRGEERNDGATFGSATIGWYFYPTEDSSNYKGEGIVQFSDQYRAGRGKLANGGGGGNSRTSGGGGGSNAGAGGNGGKESSGAGGSDIGGAGGAALEYSNATDRRKIFLGGAGGCAGREDQERNTSGANGGGIIVIQASAIQPNSYLIRASGVDNTVGDGSTFPEVVLGGGGGGAGGTVLLDIGTISSTLQVKVNGGKGSDTRHNLNCHGPGGGGGGGCVWVSGSSAPTNLSVSAAAGLAGKTYLPAVVPSSCKNTVYGAADGANGTTITNLVLTSGSIPR
ncbi:MAG: hypothetical protein JST22_07865 [Bacteroidetes bacterium]|nr:hypothetical protein [Bacteroidota bacterium]